MNSHVLKKTIIIIALLSLSALSSACIDKGIVKDLSSNKGTYQFSLNSGTQYEIFGNKHPFLPMIQASSHYAKEICLTNATENYPTQLVVNFSDFLPSTLESANCVKKGFIRKIYGNANYDWFHLEDGFSIRVVHRSALTPELYQAAFTKKEVCITEMNLGATDGTWGIPRKMRVVD